MLDRELEAVIRQLLRGTSRDIEVNDLTVRGDAGIDGSVTADKIGIGTTSPDYAFEIIGDNDDATLVHIGDEDDDTGMYLLSTQYGDAAVLAGMIYNGSEFIAKDTEASALILDGSGNTVIYGNTSLTPGSAVTPSQVVALNHDGVVINESGLDHDFRIETDDEPNFIFIDGNANTLRVGDMDTNYAQFAVDGELSLVGTARVTKCLWLAAGGIRAPGGKPATFASYGLTGAWVFADQGVADNQETVSGTLKIPCDMDITVAPLFHVGWSADGESPGVCDWQLEYLWLSPNEATDGAAQETLHVPSTASSTADGFVFATITGVDVPSATDKAMLWRVKRLSAGEVDTIGDTVEMRGCALTYTVNKLGTAT